MNITIITQTTPRCKKKCPVGTGLEREAGVYIFKVIYMIHDNRILSRSDIECLPNFKKQTREEYSSACPFCGAGPKDTDRFRFWPDVGNYWCRKCEVKGFVDGRSYNDLSPDERAELERRNIAREAAAKKRRQDALTRLQAERHDRLYHRNLNGKSAYVRERWGLNEGSIDAFTIGYCRHCPTSPNSDSITIPYYWKDQLINIRHRLNAPNGRGKYRPELAGLPSAIYQADLLDYPDPIVLVEGEFKALVLLQYGFPAVAIPGANNFAKKWVRLFAKPELVYVALDPGVEAQAKKIAAWLTAGGVNVRLCSFPVKPDDFFVLYKGTSAQFQYYLTAARPL